jgi:hypothetical protein
MASLVFGWAERVDVARISDGTTAGTADERPVLLGFSRFALFIDRKSE